jgi:hypothetical protein
VKKVSAAATAEGFRMSVNLSSGRRERRKNLVAAASSCGTQDAAGQSSVRSGAVWRFRANLCLLGCSALGSAAGSCGYYPGSACKIRFPEYCLRTLQQTP